MPETPTPPAETKFELSPILRRLGPVGPMAMVALFAPAVGGIVILSTASKSAPWIREHSPQSMAIYALAVALLAGLAVLPTYSQAILAGWAFGSIPGVCVVVTGMLGACAIAFALSRKASGDRLTKMIEENPRARAVYFALLKSSPLRTLGIVSLVRLPPNSPFALTNLVLSSVGVPFWIYMTGSLIGLLPRTAAAAYIGSTLATFDSDVPGSTTGLIVGIVVTLVVVLIIGQIAKRALARLTAETQTPPATTSPSEAAPPDAGEPAGQSLRS